MLHEILNATPNGVQFIIDHWQTILAYSFGGVSVATIVHKVEVSRGYQDFQKFGLFLLSLLSTAVVLANYVIQAHAQNPTVLPKNFAFLFSASVFLHKFAVTPAGAKLLNIKTNTLLPFFEAVGQIKAAKQPLNTTAGEAPAQPPQEFSLERRI